MSFAWGGSEDSANLLDPGSSGSEGVEGPQDAGPFFATAAEYVNSYRDKAFPIFFRKAPAQGHNPASTTKLQDTTVHQPLAVSQEPYVLAPDRRAAAAVAGTTKPSIPARMRAAIVMLLSR